MTAQTLRDGQPISYTRFRWVVLAFHVALMVLVLGGLAFLFAHDGQGMRLVETYLELARRMSGS